MTQQPIEDSIKYMPLREFIDEGYLQEINRLLLHPAGLAMALHALSDELTNQTVIKIWDYRDNPKGILFAPGEISQEKIERVVGESAKHSLERLKVMGDIWQSVDSVLTSPED